MSERTVSGADAPRALVVTSVGSPESAVTPVLAALEVAGVSVRAIDVGRIGSRSESTASRVMRALVGELAERRLLRELTSNPPDVSIAFDPGAATALSVARDEAARPAPVLAVVAELSPASAWGRAGADRYLAVDDEAAVALADLGIEGDRILPVGPIGEVGFAEAARQSQATLRSRFKISDKDPVVLVEVAGLGYETAQQIALQLSLTAKRATFLFAAGSDAEAASALRRQVPALEMRAKLFGEIADAPLLWRCADVVVARPRLLTVSRALVLGLKVVCFLPESKVGESLARALEERKVGATAHNALLISSALEPLLAAPAAGGKRVGADGAASAADVAWVLGRQRSALMDEKRAEKRADTSARVASAASAAQAAARQTAAPGELEDLSGGIDVGGDAAPTGPDPREIVRLRAELSARMERLKRTVADALKRAEEWQKRRDKALKDGGEDLARQADRNADLERARMHSALAELAQTEEELAQLEKAAASMPREPSRPPPPRPPPARSRAAAGQAARAPRAPRSSVDDMLDKLKREQTAGRARATSVDDELEALKQRMRS